MGLLDLQSVLTRLYTDSAFRERFFTSPPAALDGTALTEAEQQQLAALDRPQVERFARSLKQKRLGLARELLPGTARVLGDRFAEAFFQYCDRQPSAREWVDEAMAFAEYLLHSEHERLNRGLPAYWRDLVTCERLRVAVLHTPPDPLCPEALQVRISQLSTGDLVSVRPRLTLQARVASCQHDMEALYPKLLRGEAMEAPPAPCFVLIARVRAATGVRLKRINAASAQLLKRCDGTRKLAEILDEAASALRLSDSERPEFAAECLRFLTPFVESGLIRLLGERRCPVPTSHPAR